MKTIHTLGLLIAFLLSGQVFGQGNEKIKLDWSKHKDWKEVYRNSEGNMAIVEYLKKGHDLTDWTEMIVVQNITLENTQGITMETIMNVSFTEAKKNAPDAVLTLIRQNNEADFPWIEYKVEVSKYLNNPNPESQFYKVFKGKQTLFFVWWATRKDNITDKEVEKWQKFFDKLEVM